jgi:hypothetical protein
MKVDSIKDVMYVFWKIGCVKMAKIRTVATDSDFLVE